MAKYDLTKKEQHWGEGFKYYGKHRYHPYTHKKFNFKEVMIKQDQDEIIN